MHLYNTMSRSVERFVPQHDSIVKYFSCGPSVYSQQHLGNYRTFLYEDILHRYLEYLGYKVQRVINFTDVEDKTIAEAKRRDVSLDQLTTPVIEQFYQDCHTLSIRLPKQIPRSSTSIDYVVPLIEVLLEKGHAYWYGNDVYFDPLTYSGFGRLFGLDMSQWPKEKQRFEKDTYPGQQWNLGDFILWHGYRTGDPVYWETQIGTGRPAWNIQDPAIILKHLGPQIDISSGAVDNLYRHHDYTIAVIEGYSSQEFCRYWLHGELLLVNDEKMSKEKGNVLFPGSLLQRGYDGYAIRFYLITTHYRQQINFTDQDMTASARRLDALQNNAAIFTRNGLSASSPNQIQTSYAAKKLVSDFEDAVNDDLHIDRAISSVERTLLPLAEARKEGELGDDDTREIANALNKIEQVLHIGL